MISIALYSWLTFRVYNLTKQPSSKVEVVINGLIPSEPGATTKQESGTTVLLFFGNAEGGKVLDHQIVSRGYADTNGEFRVEVERAKIGETINCRIRHAAYEFMDEEILIMPYGAFHTAKMRPDGFYQGDIRGADVGDLAEYNKKSARKAEGYQKEAFQQLQASGYRLSQIPFLYWLRYYFLAILTFALDYLIFGSFFKEGVTNVIDALYLSAVTVTTLGYGDIVPVHWTTKLLTGLQAVSGVVLVGLFLNSLFAERSSKD